MTIDFDSITWYLTTMGIPSQIFEMNLEKEKPDTSIADVTRYQGYNLDTQWTTYYHYRKRNDIQESWKSVVFNIRNQKEFIDEFNNYLHMAGALLIDHEVINEHKILQKKFEYPLEANGFNVVLLILHEQGNMTFEIARELDPKDMATK